MSRTPEAITARKAIDAVFVARRHGGADQETIDWVTARAYEVFRRDAREDAERQIAQEAAFRSQL